jgi:hypothetical protein
VVENVKELAPETQAHPLGEPKLALHGKIGLKRSEAAQHIASEVTLLSSVCWCESAAVENLSSPSSPIAERRKKVSGSG